MAQHPWTPMDATVDDGVTLVDRLNQSFPAVYSNHAGNAIPTAPVQGQFWVDTATLPVLTIKQYDGAVWRDLWTVNVTDGTLGGPFAGGGGGGGASVTISATPPASPKTGDLWFDSVRLNTFVYYEDADSSQWVQIVPTSSGLSQDVADNRYLRLSGALPMTGPLTLQSANPSQDYHAVPRKFLMDELAKKPAIPVNGTDVAGGVFVIASAAGATVSLPAGGTWLAFRQQFNTATGSYAFVHQMSVLPGGHTFSAPASPFAWVGWAWRIA